MCIIVQNNKNNPCNYPSQNLNGFSRTCHLTILDHDLSLLLNDDLLNARGTHATLDVVTTFLQNWKQSSQV